MDIQILCNTDDETLFRNIEINSARNLPWLNVEPEHDGHSVICGGGPSLKNSLGEIRRRVDLGQKVFALNNAAKFLKENGIRADYTVICDARPHNAAFIGNSHHCLVASQCDPATVERAQAVGVTLWHPVIEGIEDHLPKYDKPFSLVGGGTTVGLSAMCLAYIMGYRKIHLFGYDSCHSEEGSHAYAQPENDKEPTCKVRVYGRTFRASLAMAQQAELFPVCCDSLIDLGCTITIDGDGLLPHIVRMMAAEKAQAMMQLEDREGPQLIPGQDF